MRGFDKKCKTIVTNDIKKIIEDMDEEEEKIWSCLKQVFEG